jgi:hypothetical protein
VKLRALLHRRQADQVPLLPAIESTDTAIGLTDGPLARGTPTPYTTYVIAQEELLERLLTPSELDLVRDHRV